jgi:hypothetical protein
MKRTLAVIVLVLAGFGVLADESAPKFERGGFTKKELNIYGQIVEEKSNGDKVDPSSTLVPVLEFESNVTLTQKPAVRNPDACNVEASISYVHLGSDVRVDTSIDNEVCAASHGNYTVKIKTLHDGEYEIQSFSEPRKRHEASHIRFTQY